MAGWNEFADTLATDPAFGAFDDAQVEAVVDLLTLVIYADDKVTMLERSEFEAQLESLPFLESKAELVHTAAERAAEAARGATDEASFKAIAGPAAARLPEGAVRAKVFEMAVTLAHADLHLHPREVDALRWMAELLGLDADEAKKQVEAGG